MQGQTSAIPQVDVVVRPSFSMDLDRQLGHDAMGNGLRPMLPVRRVLMNPRHMSLVHM